jgi:hypothetical protein
MSVSESIAVYEPPCTRTPIFGPVWSELRHLAYVLLVLGVGVSAIVAIAQADAAYPIIGYATGVAYHEGEILSAFLFLLGAWLAMRDRRSATTDLISSTPTEPGLVRATRLGALAVASAAAFGLLFLIGLASTLAHGGSGVVDWVLVPDGMLGSALVAWLGFALGLVASAPVVVLGAALYSGGSYFINTQYTHYNTLHVGFQWLLPFPPLPQWSADLGYVPNIFGTHLVFVLGWLLLTGGLIVTAPFRRPLGTFVSRVALTGAVAGLVLATVFGVQLQAKANRYTVRGPDPASWVPEYEQYASGLSTPDPRIYPDDHRATVCASSSAVRVCVYPAYGRSLATSFISIFDPEARAIESVIGRPTYVRMVPVAEESCSAGLGQAVLTEQQLFGYYYHLSGYLISCALPQLGPRYYVGLPPDHPAQSAVALWLVIRSGELTPSAVRRGVASWGVSCLADLPCTPEYGDIFGFRYLSWTRAEIGAGLAMAALPPDRVASALRELWPRLVAGKLSLTSLPGYRR